MEAASILPIDASAAVALRAGCPGARKARTARCGRPGVPL